MVKVIGVRFLNAGKLYYFDPGTTWATPGDYVLVETTRGIELGEVVMPVHELDETQLVSPLQPVVRLANEQDVQHHKDNKAAEKEAYVICQKKIGEHRLDMKLVSVEYTFDNSKILFYFTSNGRVDFRALVKDLASVFKTRIELRQIGVRDEAKMLGGLGPCGRPICCGTFLGDFQPVSIKMAKEQNLSLNPTKISGVCGRLMCCLKYEEDTYEQTRKRMPKIGRDVYTPDGWGTVWDLNIVKETVRIRVQKGDTSEVKDYTLDELNEANVARKAENGDKMPERPVQKETPAEKKQDQEAVAGNEQDRPTKPVQRPARERRDRSERPERIDRGERAERPERTERRERNGENKLSRGERAVQPVKNQKPQEQVADKTAAAEATAPVKPAAQANAWKMALEKAMRAAQGDEDNHEQPLSNEDHAEPDEVGLLLDEDEDDTI